MFKPESPPEDLGVDFAKHPMNEDTVEEGIVDFVGALGRKPGWPDLTPLRCLSVDYVNALLREPLSTWLMFLAPVPCTSVSVSGE